MKLLVLGATGDQGLPQVGRALERGHDVRVAARDCGRARTTFGADVECVAADWSQPSTLSAAMHDIDVVLANFPSSSFNDGGPLVAAAHATARAARERDVSLVVLNTSMPVGREKRGYAAQDVRFEMRAALKAGGVPLVSIEPVVFLDNLLRGWAYPQITRHDRFVYPHRADLEVSWLCLHDLAALMIAAAERPRLAGRRYAVGGPAPLRGPEIAAHLSTACGRRIEFESQPIAEFCDSLRGQMRAAQTGDVERMLEELARLYHWYNDSPERPFRIEMGPVLDELPVTLTSARDWIAQQDWNRR